MGSDGPASTIRIPVLLWRRVIRDLRQRGAGKGESGAFLLGRELAGSRRVVAHICYDDIDRNAYQSGVIAFHAAGYAALWQRCREMRLQVLADVHTHPGAWVEQSAIDQRHPMVPIGGHTAMIVPHFGDTPWWSLRAVGVHEYLGEFTWRRHACSGLTARVRLCPW